MHLPLAARKRVALGLVVTAILALCTAMYAHYRGADDPGKPDGRAIAGRNSDIAAGMLRLEGKTVDHKRRPLGGVRISLDGARTTTSAADGSFVFDQLAPEHHTLTAEKGIAYGETAVSLDEHSGPEEIWLHIGPMLVVRVVDRAGAPVAGAKVMTTWCNPAFTDRDGKATLRGAWTRPTVTVDAPGYASTHLDVQLGEDPGSTVEQKVVLGPTAPIGGVVIDEDGAPVAGADVVVEQSDHSWSTQVTSDARGRWQMDGFGAGRLKLAASSAAYLATPEPLVAFDGKAPQLDLVIHVERGATIGGVAVDMAGRPVAGVEVKATNYPWWSGRSDDHGRFWIAGIPPGEAKVEASTDTLGAPTQTVELPRGGHVDVTFQMVESGIAGIVTNLQGEPVANAYVGAHGAVYADAMTDAAGHFALKHVAVGDYAVSVARKSAADLLLNLSDDHAVTAHSGDPHVALVLPDVARITGRVVLDGRPVEFFGVAADPKLSPEPQYTPDGRFELEMQTRTEWPEQRYLVFVGPGFQRRFLDTGVFTGSGQTTDLGDIVVTAGKTVRGRVVGASGAPVAGAVVVVQPGNGLETELSLDKQGADSRGARSDASGRFAITGLPGDLSDLRIQAQHPELGQALPRRLTAADLRGDIKIVLVMPGRAP